MTTYMFFAIKNTKTGKLIDIDHDSGGYPYDVSELDAQRFDNLSIAKNYCKHFNYLVPVQVTMTVDIKEV